jgi:hypothetical protein
MTSNSLAVYTPEKQREVIKLMGFKGTPEHTALLFQLAEHYQLDPLTKEISLIPGKGPFIGVWGRLHIGHRSGMLDGFEADDETYEDGLYIVRCVVWRKDMGHPAAKVKGRVADREKKDWPFEIARARAVRAAFGYAFNIHDTYDEADEDWAPAPDERLPASVVAAGPTEEVNTPAPAAAPKRTRRVNKKTGEVVDVPPDPPEPPSGVAASGETAGPSTVLPGSAPAAPDTEPATVLVGGHTLAQKLAMAARKADCDDDKTRHEVIQAASRGTYQRGTDIPEDGYDPDLVDRIFEAFAGLADGTVELRYAPDGTPKLYRIRR